MTTADPLARYVAGEDVAVGPELLAEADRARAFAAGGGDPPALQPPAARALVQVLVERRDAERLSALAQAGGRDVAKEARRGLHLLRTRGIAAAPAPRPAVTAPAVQATGERAEAWAAAPDGAGERLFSILKPAPGGGFDLVHVTLSDAEGLVDVVVGRGPRKLWRDLRRRFDERRLAFAEVPYDWAAAVIDEAYERTLALGRSPPPDFGSARGVIGRPAKPLPAEHPALEAAPSGPPPSRDEAAALHMLPEILSWAAPRPVLETLSLRLQEVDTSTLLVDDRQRREARAAAVDRAIEAACDEAGRARWRARLLDAAYVFARAGRGPEARLLRGQADRLAAADFAPIDDAFARLLVEKVLHPELRAGLVDAATGAPGETPRDTRIITP